ncbi:methyl jasmonate esterase 1-like [Carex rostrata]
MASLLFQLPPQVPQLYPKPNLLLSKTNTNPLLTLRRKPPPNCTKQDHPTPSSRHFVLVHGMCHGGWAWYKLATLLNEAGHHVTAPDLAACGLHPKRLDEVNTFEEYCEPLMEVMEAVPANERVVLVGHSYGGTPVSLAMERYPHKIAVAVFISAAMPSSTNSLADITKELYKEGLKKDMMDSKAVYGGEGDNIALRSFTFGWKHLQAIYYHLCAPEDVTLATMVLRPGKPFYDSSVTREDFVTAENHGSVSRVYLVCNQDKSILPETQKWLVEMSPGTELLELDGADHMPMLCMPKKLFSLLVDISDRYQ